MQKLKEKAYKSKTTQEKVYKIHKKLKLKIRLAF